MTDEQEHKLRDLILNIVIFLGFGMFVYAMWNIFG